MYEKIPDLLDTHAAAEVLGLSARSLEGMRSRGGGPTYVKVGPGPRAKVRYPVRDLLVWLDAQRRRSTSDRSAA